MNSLQCLFSLVNGYLAYFQIFAIANSTATNLVLALAKHGGMVMCQILFRKSRNFKDNVKIIKANTVKAKHWQFKKINIFMPH